MFVADFSQKFTLMSLFYPLTKGTLSIYLRNCYMSIFVGNISLCSLTKNAGVHFTFIIFTDTWSNNQGHDAFVYLVFKLLFIHYFVPADEIFRYANEPGIMKYIKIAATLPDKTVRDVAMRCQWMAAVSPWFLLSIMQRLNAISSYVVFSPHFKCETPLVANSTDIYKSHARCSSTLDYFAWKEHVVPLQLMDGD